MPDGPEIDTLASVLCLRYLRLQHEEIDVAVMQGSTALDAKRFYKAPLSFVTGHV